MSPVSKKLCYWIWESSDLEGQLFELSLVKNEVQEKRPRVTLLSYLTAPVADSAFLAGTRRPARARSGLGTTTISILAAYNLQTAERSLPDNSVSLKLKNRQYFYEFPLMNLLYRPWNYPICLSEWLTVVLQRCHLHARSYAPLGGNDR
jgi:hypothetical protein